MGPKFTLITAILMTLAAVTWLVSAVFVPQGAGVDLKRWGVVIAFSAMAAIYWRIYFKRKTADVSGTK